MTSTTTTPATILWLRRDLRLGDNPALLAAAQTAHDRGGALLPVYVWEPPESRAWAPGGAARWWLWRSLQSLDGEPAPSRLPAARRARRPGPGRRRARSAVGARHGGLDGGPGAGRESPTTTPWRRPSREPASTPSSFRRRICSPTGLADAHARRQAVHRLHAVLARAPGGRRARRCPRRRPTPCRPRRTRRPASRSRRSRPRRRRRGRRTSPTPGSRARRGRTTGWRPFSTAPSTRTPPTATGWTSRAARGSLPTSAGES